MIHTGNVFVRGLEEKGFLDESELNELISYIKTNLDKVTFPIDYLELNDEFENGSLPVGSIWFDKDDKTLNAKITENVTANIPTEQLAPRCVNKTGVTIPNGKVVYISGVQGNRPTISLANADSYANTRKVIGVTTESFDNNAEGFVCRNGYVRDVDTSSWVAGTCLYLDTTDGELTDTKPAIGNSIITVGMVMYQHSQHGIICVKISEDLYRFGDVENGNYTYMDNDGTVRYVGNATVFDDEIGSALQLKVQGTGVSIDSTNNNLDFATNSNLADFAYDNYQTKHARKLNTNIFMHIHWLQKEDNVPNFLMRYKWCVAGQEEPTSWADLTFSTLAFEYNSEAALCQISGGGTITPPANDNVSNILKVQLFRDNSNASGEFAGSDPYTQTANVLFVDFHYEKDANGSNLQYAK